MGISLSEIYGNLGITTTDPVMSKIPRFKFNFLLEIQLGNNSSGVIKFERVRTATLPEVSFDTKIMNQYNVKRVVQSKMNYGTCTVAFYDTYDNDFLTKIAIPYSKNYYNNGDGLNKISDTFATTDSITSNDNAIIGNFGLTTTTPANRYFIPEIRIKKVGPDANIFDHIMKNCMITSIAGDTMDYGDSQPVQFTVTFQPERMELTSNPNSTTR
jgi:hypothetical protein